MADKLVTVSDVKKVYTKDKSTITVLNGVSLNVSPGEFAVIHGASGSGKSTLLLCMGGLLKPDAGTVTIGNTNFYSMHNHERSRMRARDIGFVFQQFHLLPYLSIRDNIGLPALAASSNADPGRIKELMQHFNLEHRQHHVPSELSIGERQRTALARALFNKPSLILADEPTGNLDPDNAQIILKHLKEYAGNNNSVVLVTHDSQAFSYADSRYILQDGKIAVYK